MKIKWFIHRTTNTWGFPLDDFKSCDPSKIFNFWEYPSSIESCHADSNELLNTMTCHILTFSDTKIKIVVVRIPSWPFVSFRASFYRSHCAGALHCHFGPYLSYFSSSFHQLDQKECSEHLSGAWYHAYRKFGLLVFPELMSSTTKSLHTYFK